MKKIFEDKILLCAIVLLVGIVVYKISPKIQPEPALLADACDSSVLRRTMETVPPQHLAERLKPFLQRCNDRSVKEHVVEAFGLQERLRKAHRILEQRYRSGQKLEPKAKLLLADHFLDIGKIEDSKILTNRLNTELQTMGPNRSDTFLAAVQLHYAMRYFVEEPKKLIATHSNLAKRFPMHLEKASVTGLTQAASALQSVATAYDKIGKTKAKAAIYREIVSIADYPASRQATKVSPLFYTTMATAQLAILAKKDSRDPQPLLRRLRKQLSQISDQGTAKWAEDTSRKILEKNGLQLNAMP